MFTLDQPTGNGYLESEAELLRVYTMAWRNVFQLIFHPLNDPLKLINILQYIFFAIFFGWRSCRL